MTPTLPPDAGLCLTCVEAQGIQSDRGSLFLLCRRALTDARFAKYPRLPVLVCAGHEPKPAAASNPEQP